MNVGADTTTYIEQMAAIERSFVAATGLADRGFYKFFTLTSTGFLYFFSE